MESDGCASPLKKTERVMRRRTCKQQIERRRRARINTCLESLKQFVMQANPHTVPSSSKLEKADILELTVKHVHLLRQQSAMMASHPLPEEVRRESYRSGFTECAQEVCRFMDNNQGMDNELKLNMLNHLAGYLNQTCPVEAPLQRRHQSNQYRVAGVFDNQFRYGMLATSQLQTRSLSPEYASSSSSSSCSDLQDHRSLNSPSPDVFAVRLPEVRSPISPASSYFTRGSDSSSTGYDSDVIPAGASPSYAAQSGSDNGTTRSRRTSMEARAETLGSYSTSCKSNLVSQSSQMMANVNLKSSDVDNSTSKTWRPW